MLPLLCREQPAAVLAFRRVQQQSCWEQTRLQRLPSEVSLPLSSVPRRRQNNHPRYSLTERPGTPSRASPPQQPWDRHREEGKSSSLGELGAFLTLPALMSQGLHGASTGLLPRDAALRAPQASSRAGRSHPGQDLISCSSLSPGCELRGCVTAWAAATGAALGQNWGCFLAVPLVWLCLGWAGSRGAPLGWD